MAVLLRPLKVLQILLLCSRIARLSLSFHLRLIPTKQSSKGLQTLQFSAHTESPCPPPVNLTIIIPAYNEVDRIGDTLRSYSNYRTIFNSSLVADFRILVVDDGSQDETVKLVRTFPGVECQSLPRNLGKGAALSSGISMLKYGELCLVADADGSASIEELPIMLMRLIQTIESSSRLHQQKSIQGYDSFWLTPAVVVGHRTILANDTSDKELSFGIVWLRSILRWGFKTTVKCLAGELGVKDTQCGFKLMTATAAQFLYHDLNLNRWTHDVEVLYRAKANQIAVAEQRIKWQEKEGSKLVQSPGGTLGVCISMLLEVVQMRLSYETGIWTMPRFNNDEKKS